MAEPKKRKSHSASRLKKAHLKFKLPQLSACSHCQEPVPQNQVCPNCGYFKGKKVLELKEKVKTKVKKKE